MWPAWNITRPANSMLSGTSHPRTARRHGDTRMRLSRHGRLRAVDVGIGRGLSIGYSKTFKLGQFRLYPSPRRSGFRVAASARHIANEGNTNSLI